MQPVTIIRHIECEGPGYLEDVLKRHGISHELIALDQNQPLPSVIKNTCGLVIMGGPMSVNDDDDWIQQEIHLVGQAIDAGLPVLGHCLGGQLIARALGAEVNANPVREIGWLPVQTATDNYEIPSWLSLFDGPQTVFHWHGETFEIPGQARRLLSSEHCDNQAFIYKNNVFAFQCHIEMTCEMIDEWSSLYASEIAHPSDTVQGREDMLVKCRDHIQRMNQIADAIYSDWISKLRGQTQ